MKNTEISKILSAVSTHKKVDIEDILSNSREARIVQARHITMWIARYYTTYTLQEIANALNCKRHATVIHGVDNIDYVTKRNATLSEELHQLAKSI